MNSRPLEEHESKNLAAVNASGFNSVLLFITSTGLEKSILDATDPMRRLLCRSGIHDYQTQNQGQENKKITVGIFIDEPTFTQTTVSLYRPKTKSGDPRLWFSDLKKYASAGDVCAVFIHNGTIYVLNLTRSKAAQSLALGINCATTRFLRESGAASNATATELRDLLAQIAADGPLKAVCAGDTAIGRTIETALGIPINSSRCPDFKGIEIKTGRSSILGRETRATLFACVPDWKLSSCKSSGAILERFGYEREGSFQLYCTVSTLRNNSQGLRLQLDEVKALLREFQNREPREDVCVWRMNELHSRLEEKHRETFWVKAKSIKRDGSEWFQLDSITHTTRASPEQFDRLLIDGTVTLDHLIKRTKSGGARERGPLFKVERQRLPELFLGETQNYVLIN
jgi:hypothetical protein